MNALVKLISDSGEGFIICLALLVFVLLIVNGIILSNHKSRIKENLQLDGSMYAINLEEQKIEEREDEKIVITPNVIRSYEAKFNAACSYHDTLAQIIPIFPLLGILGTVAGLMYAVGLDTDVSSANEIANKMTTLYDGMGAALGTTLYGLIAAIILKLTDALFTSRIISDVDVMIDDFNKKLELASIFKQS